MMTMAVTGNVEVPLAMVSEQTCPERYSATGLIG